MYTKTQLYIAFVDKGGEQGRPSHCLVMVATGLRDGPASPSGGHRALAGSDFALGVHSQGPLGLTILQLG